MIPPNQFEDMPELSLHKCKQYSISKDSFTEIVLLTVISYFCVSTEHRFINMNQEREKNNATSKSNGGEPADQLNQSNPSTIRSAGPSGGGLNSTLQRSTKDRTQTSSTQRQIITGQHKNPTIEAKNIDISKSQNITSLKSPKINS